MKQHFIENFGADPDFLQDIGMESKGLEFSEYVTKESLAQQGGYSMALKGAQHDEAWLIFMDQVNNQLPTFEDKAEALHYFPMWRTWFSLHGLCKLPWNDILPANNDETDEPKMFDLTGMKVRTAMAVLNRLQVKYEIVGGGVVKKQFPAPGAGITNNSGCRLTCDVS